MGRKPLPTQLKKLKGTLRADRINPNEPEPDPNIPPVPPHLDKKAQVEYARITAELHEVGLMSNLDLAAISAYCDVYSQWEQASEAMEGGPLIIKTKAGNIIQNPLIGIKNTTREQMRRFLVEFGLTPASRSKVVARKEKPEKENPFAAIAKQRKGGK